MARPLSDVVLAAIADSAGRYLVSLRHPHLLGGDHWEFPGGKREPGESEPEALAREIKEEVNIEIESAKFLRRYLPPPGQEGKPSLSLYEVRGWHGDLRHNEGQAIDWRSPDEIAGLRILPGSLALLDCLLLAPIACITPEWTVDEMRALGVDAICRRLERVREWNDERVQLHWRQPYMAVEEQIAFLQPLAERCRQLGIAVVAAHSLELAERSGADFVHLKSDQLSGHQGNADSLPLFGCAVHSAAEIDLANQMGARYGLISPVLPTRSKPTTVPLGWRNFRAMATQLNGLGYALGGMQAQDLAQVREWGGFGIAGIRFWSYGEVIKGAEAL